MNHYYDPYTRLETYYNLMAHDVAIDSDYDDASGGSHALGVSMSRTCESTGIPLKVIRQDIFGTGRLQNHV